MLLDAVDSFGVSYEGHGQLIGSEEDRVRIVGPFGHRFAESRKGVLRDHPGVGEPFPVWLYPCTGYFLGLVWLLLDKGPGNKATDETMVLTSSSFGDFPFCISLRPSLL